MSDSQPLDDPRDVASAGAHDGAQTPEVPACAGTHDLARPLAVADHVRDAKPRTVRDNEWTRARMVAFLRELAASRSVAFAARSVGMSRQGAYKLRRRMQGTRFARAWQAALAFRPEALAETVTGPGGGDGTGEARGRINAAPWTV